MFDRIKLNVLEDYFTASSGRIRNGVYFCRLTKYSKAIDGIICRYIDSTRKKGVCISNKIDNPDEKQLNYYNEMMGREFQLNPNFFVAALKKWLPRLGETQRTIIANCFYDIFIEMARNGKTKNMQENAYIKFMCWLYYKFTPILSELGHENLPKILFEGYLTDYELKMLTILSKSGCDILLLEYNGDEKYLTIDKDSEFSELLDVEGGNFPDNYSILELQRRLANKVIEPDLKAFKPEKIINTNTWIKGEPLVDTLLLQSQRGNDSNFFYGLYAGIYGVEDISTYYADLMKWKVKLENSNKKWVLIEGKIQPPTYEEISAVNRKNYNSTQALLNDLVMQIQGTDKRFQLYCQNAFMSVFGKMVNHTVQEVLNLAVIQLCWLNRYTKLLSGSQDAVPLFLYYGEVKDKNEILLFKILENLPIDILVINPELNQIQEAENSLFFAKKYDHTLKRERFPAEINGVQLGTVAYQAEQDLNSMIYQDTGLYRNQQFKEAITVTLQITYEEIAILWDQEAKYRPNFEVFNDKVMVPVIFSKVSGVQGNIDDYWEKVSGLMSEDTFIIKGFPHVKNGVNSFKDKAYLFLQGGQLEIPRIKNHATYPFSFIRESMQDYMLHKLQELINSRAIVGTGVNGMENLIVSTILDMDKKLLRLIQKYDFTKDIPKILVIHTKESSGTPEDSILLAYLNLIGFDIALYVPTGYTTVERFYSRPMFVEHQVGEYQYDLEIPDLDVIAKKQNSFASKIFRRGR